MIGIAKSDAERRATFLRLMAEYQAAMFRLAAAYVDDPRDREDMVQEIAIGLWQAIPRFRGESSERTWLYRIAHNIAITASAKLRRRGRTESAIDEVADPPAAKAPSADQQLIQQQRRELMLRAVRELPALDRQILALHLEDLSHREIQDVTGLSEGAIATRLSRMRERLTREIRGTEVGRP